jgi:hypothetical protein
LNIDRSEDLSVMGSENLSVPVMTNESPVELTPGRGRISEGFTNREQD